MFRVPTEVAASPPTAELSEGRLTILLSVGESWGQGPCFLQDSESAGVNTQSWNQDSVRSQLPPYLHRWGALGYGLVQGCEGRHGRHEHIIAHQDVPLHQGLDQRGWGHCDVCGDLGRERKREKNMCEALEGSGGYDEKDLGSGVPQTWIPFPFLLFPAAV